MNLNGDDERIQLLFREMRQDDERLAPRFARVIDAASASAPRATQRIWSLSVAGVIAMLCVAVLVAAFIIARNPKSEWPAKTDDLVSNAPASSDKRAEPLRIEAPAAQSPTKVRRVQHRRTPNDLAIARSLFAWQSPTASLLKFPDEEIFKSLPRLGESFETIRIISPDDLLN